MWLFHYVVTDGGNQFHGAHMDKLGYGAIPKSADLETMEDHITLQRSKSGYTGYVRIVSFSRLGDK